MRYSAQKRSILISYGPAMKKIFNFALVFAMTFSSAALYAQGAPATPTAQNTEPAQAPSGQVEPAVSGNLEGMNEIGGLPPAMAVTLGVGLVAVAAAVAGGGSGGSGSSGTTGTTGTN